MNKMQAVIFGEGEGWIAQGLEHDICVSGKSREEVTQRFRRSLIENAIIAWELGKAFSNIPKAPQEFWDMPSTDRATFELPV